MSNLFDEIYALKEQEVEFPYIKENNEFTNIIPIENIIANSGIVHLYDTNGKEIIPVGRFCENDYCNNDFTIKFNENNFKLVYSQLSCDFLKITKREYNYDGKLLYEKKLEKDYNDIINATLKDEEKSM